MALAFDFFLSDRDDGLSRTSSRDPLGFEVLWTAFGRRVVPHLSTVSLGATNFAVLLVLLDTVQRYVEGRQGDSRLEFADLFVAVDSLHVYDVLTDPSPGMTARLLGRQRAAANQQSGRVLIGPGHEVLANQIGLGLYGRYIKPLESMELVDSSGGLLDDARRATDAVPGIKTVRSAVAAFLEHADKGKPVPLVSFKEAGVLRELRTPQVLACFRDLLMQRLHVDEQSTHQVRRVWDTIGPMALTGVGAETARTVLQSLRRDDPVIDDVCQLEWVLCRLDAIFELLFSASRLSELEKFEGAQDIATNLAEFGPAILGQLEKTRELTDAGRARIKALTSVVAAGDPAAVGSGLIDYHSRIMEDRKRAAWLGVTEAGRLMIIHSASGTSKVVPRWRRNYYLSSLAEIRADLEQLEAAQ